MVAHRSLRALLVDVGAARRNEIAAAMSGAGWTVHTESVAGTDALSAALARRGWDVVIYGGEGEGRGEPAGDRGDGRQRRRARGGGVERQ